MMWGLAAALAAGIAGNVRILAASVFLFGWYSHRGETALGGGPGRRRMAALAALAVLFFLYGRLSVEHHEAGTRAFEDAAAASGGTLCVEGWVASYPQYRYGGMTFELAARVGAESGDRRVLVRTKEYRVGYGDSVRVRGRIYHARGDRRLSYARYLKSRGIVGELRVPPAGVERLGGRAGNPFCRSVLWPVHQRIRCELVRGLGARSGVPVALLIGERGFLPAGASGTFARLGISHLLALSGLHLGFVAGALLLIFRITGCKNRYLLIIALAAYVGIVGFIISLTRALLMASLLIAASMLHRPLRPVTALGNAFLLILLVYPTSFFSLGFQLSFLATYGVLRCVPLMARVRAEGRLRRVWLGIRSSLLVSVSAQLFVAPVIAHAFGRISVVAPVTTLICVLPVAALLAGAAVCALLSIVSTAAGPLGFAVLERGAVMFDALVERLVDIAPEPVPAPPPNIYLYYAGLALMYRTDARMRTRAAGAALVIAGCAAGRFF
ncbi:MAG: ComEC/Rec2 family competence protein [bacterium]